MMRCSKCDEPILIRDEQGYEKAIDCKCEVERRKKARLKKFDILSINDRNSGMDIFKNAKFDCNEEKKLYKTIFNYCKNYETVLTSEKKRKGMLFLGVPGNGKTFLANCVCNKLKKDGYSVLSFSFGGYLRMIKDSYKTGKVTETELLQAVRDVDMLFIDDLGSEKMSDDWGKPALFSLIDERYRSGKPIMLTSNLTLQQFEERTLLNGSDKIIDRIREMTKTFSFIWESKRAKQDDFWEDYT